MKPRLLVPGEYPLPARTCLTAATLVAILSAGCELAVSNPNAPDVERAFGDPAGLTQLLRGAMPDGIGARAGFSVEALSTMADSYTSGFSHAGMRYYSSVGADCPSRCGWSNSTSAAHNYVVEASWYGYYTVLTSANDVLRAIDGGVCFDADCRADNTVTSRNKTFAKMLQGMALSGIAQLYDQGFVVDENSDLRDPRSLAFNTRAEVRDAALAKFEEAWTEAGTRSWSTPGEWMGEGGRPYSNAELRRVIRTMQAELVALWSRNAVENAQAAWSQVATFASQGISNPAPGFPFEFSIDASGRYEDMDAVKTVGNSIGSVRVDTRVASMLASNHQHPWPEPHGNPCPTVSADRRVGDGSWGPADNFNGYSTQKATANAGTDFACSQVVIFPPSRGGYHQSNLAHVRYQHLGYAGENLPGYDGTGPDPMYTVQMSDLLWAEGLIRSGGDRALAAQLIDKSRVGRGGLPALTGSESEADLLDALHYEQEIEFMGQGTTPFFNLRRIDGLVAGTPRHMPVPAKELQVLLQEIYSFGGPDHPDMSIVGTGGARGGSRQDRVRSVREIWEQYRAMRSAARR